jgi:polyvinyl alcohol dehydrogenase (cytochrome)
MLRPRLAGRDRTFIGVALGSAIIAGLALSTRADGPDHRSSWPMIGHDVRNTRSQDAELKIDRRNVSRLLPKWTLTTAGDVSATPTVVKGHGRGDDDDDDAKAGRVFGLGDFGDRGKHGGDRGHEAVYFPDWGGMLWSVDGETGQVIWSRKISDYNGITGSISRTSPAFAHGMIFVGDLNGNMMGVNARTGDLVWITELDPNPNTIVTTSPIVLGNRLYISTSSSGGGVARQIFRGSLSALDIRTGQIIWQTFVLPDNGGVPGGFAGGAFVNPPAIDVDNGLIFGAAGQSYNQPASVTACLAAVPGGWDENCFPAGAYFNSVIAFDLRTGAPRWSFRGAGPDARRLGCGDTPPAWCPPWENNFSVWDFAGSGANVFRARVNGRWRDLVGIGQKSGVYWTLDARTGKLVWATLVGHGGDPGGIQWGSAIDDDRIYAAIGHVGVGTPYTLPSGQTITGGSWAALDPRTGRIIWQVADPLNAPDLGALTVANGVVYAGSMAHTGDQMYALNSRTGDILWRFSAGGSVVDGPAVVSGTVFWGSGYARTGGVGNDQFFAFSVDGK